MIFLKNIKKELEKTTWLKWKDVFIHFLSIHLIVISILIYFGLIDSIVYLFK